MKKLLILSALALLVGATDCSAKKFRYDTPAGKVKLISYNIRQSGANDGDNCWMNRRPATVEMMRREAPSVIGMQEVKLDQAQYIEENMPQYARVGVGRDDGKDKGEMCAIYYLKKKFELLDSGTFWLSETPDAISRGWDAKYNRIVTWVKLREKATGKEFFFFNGHLDHKGVTARKESMKLIVRKIFEIAGKDSAVILGGDFNALINDDIYTPVKEVSTLARTAAPVTDSRPTFNSWGRRKGDIIDHLFVRNLNCLEYRTLDGDYGVPFISDHYPVQLVFEVK